MKKQILIIALLLSFLASSGHPWKPAHNIIIDTDCGIDDMRTITILLASPDVNILGIIVSAGALSPYDGYKKMKSMLNSYHHEGIPVTINYNLRGLDLPLPSSVKWGDESNIRVPETNGFNKLCRNIVQNGTTGISFIALASLNSISELINSGVFTSEHVAEIIWSNGSLSRLSGFNYNIDRRSVNKILKCDIPLKTIGYPGDKTFYSESFINDLNKINSRYTAKICSVIKNSPGIDSHDFAWQAADEMTVIYLHYPDLFLPTNVKDHQFFRPGNIDDLRYHIIKIIRGETVSRNQVFKSIPTDTSFYQPDLQPFINDIISNHGIDEWECGVLTNEMHRHLGVYSIIGVKMGILAREYFHVGVDMIEVISFAGSMPPLSCMNDGLQISTGATTGHGLLNVTSEELSAMADFTHNGVTIRIRLNEDIANKVNKELKELNFVHGLDSDIYWELVRQRAILHWKNLSRYEIFNISVGE